MMEHHGTAESFVRTLLANSRAGTDALITLHTALETLVLQFDLQPVSRPKETLRLFELLVAFKPRGGLVPVVEMLRRIGATSPACAGGSAAIDLHAYALAVMEAYFPLAAPHAAEYDVYVRILREHLGYERYVGHALVRLLDMGALQIGDAMVGDVCAEQPGALRAVLQYYLQPRHAVHAGSALGKVYIHMRRRNLQALVAAAESLGATVTDLSMLALPAIHYRGRHIPLVFTDPDRGILVMHESERFDEKLKAESARGNA
jgi:hypothetical protein